MFTFKKNERLCSEILIDKLFKEGSSFLCYPLRIGYIPIAENPDTPVRVVVSVSKKRFKRAVKRNLLKRRIREAYRLHKPELYNCLINKELNILLSIGYIGKEIMPYEEIDKAMEKALDKLATETAHTKA